MHPLAPVRAHLARQRQAGVTFDVAFDAALELAPGAWREVLREMRGAWRAAYARQGPHEFADVVALRRAAAAAARQRRGGVRLVA